MTAEFGPLDALYSAAVVRHDRQQEGLLEMALAEIQATPGLAPTPLVAALWYASKGVPVFPLQPGSKKPFPGSRGFHDATTDPSTVHTWWCTGQHNIGTPTGHQWDVIDIDGPDGQAEFVETLTHGEYTINVLGITQTPRGFHIWVPADPNAKNYSYGETGIDYRGKGGYVVIPPSRTELGSYRWLVPPII